jgi:hypothetical protein
MSGNLKLYNKVRNPPKEALKNFSNGTFSGTDINTMWRIKELTEQFGQCGVGWYYTIDRQWIEQSGDEMMAMSNISLYTNTADKWSMPIAGTGGNKFATFVKSKSYIKVSDECYKMATTDALGNAMKSLGFGADIYWANDRTKYSNSGKSEAGEEIEDKKKDEVDAKICNAINSLGYNAKQIPEMFRTKYSKKYYDSTVEEREKFLKGLNKAIKEKEGTQ